MSHMLMTLMCLVLKTKTISGQNSILASSWLRHQEQEEEFLRPYWWTYGRLWFPY